MTESHAIRILIVDDHPMVRGGLKDFILAYDWLEAVGEAQNAHAVDRIAYLQCQEFREALAGSNLVKLSS